ncbi:MAG: hypothetical protein EOP51_17835, partial [Sphingobacteriales bacterium]
INLSGSQSGVTYQLYNGASAVGAALNGTGSAISFGNQTAAGTYTVTATNTSTSCTINMTGTPVVTVNPLPTVFSVTGGGAYCSGGAGIVVGLNGSQSGINYQLYNGASAVGSPVNGTGSAISFGNQAAAGTYTVVAANATSTCSNNMTGSVVITITPLPTVSAGPAVCVGSSMTLSPTTGGTWSSSNNLIATVTNAGVVTGVAAGSVSFTFTQTSTGCSRTTSSVTVNAVTPFIANITTSPSSLCLGGSSNLSIANGTSSLLTENFEGVNSFTVVNGAPHNAGSSWTLRTSTYNYDYDCILGIFCTTVSFNSGSKFMVSTSRDYTNTSTSIVSPTISTMGYNSLNLQYRTYYRWANNDVAIVEVSIDNGSSWTIVENLETIGTNIGTSQNFSTRNINLNAYINTASFKIRFRYQANDKYWWAIDDIIMTGSAPVDNYSWTATPSATAGLPAGAGIPSAANANINVLPTAAGTYTYTAALTNAAGCTSTKNVSLVVNPLPVVTIGADYCIVPGKVRLTATATSGSILSWSPGGASTTFIDVDVAGEYSVTATNGLCSSTEIINVANELVSNGDFSAGNTGFITPPLGANQYQYRADIAGNSELVPEGLYGVGTDGQNYHGNFWGKDHTTGSGNYMIVNGFPNGNPQPIVWQQTVEVLPNTVYYFSAWGMSLNNVGPFAQLQFNVNGMQVGTNPVLPGGVNNNSNNGWTRFYGTWTSGASVTSAVISITDLQNAPGGNDFGIDDISFATLSTFTDIISAPGTEAQTVCVNTPITDIVYRSGNGDIAGPTVTGLPPGVSKVFVGDKLTISGTPTTPGVYTYTVTTTGCAPYSVTGTITVQTQTMTLSAGASSPTICINSALPMIQYTIGGSATGAALSAGAWPAGVNGVFNAGKFTITGIPTVAGVYPYSITTAGTCEDSTISGTITVQQQAISLTSGLSTQNVCLNEDISAIVYTISGTGTGANVTGLPPGVNGFYSGGIFIISGTPLAPASGIYNYTVTSTGTCSPAATQSGSITINPAASINLTSAVGTDAQSVCINTALAANITYNIAGGGTNASVSGLPAGLSGTYSAGILTISGTPTIAGTFTYTITTTGTCAQATKTGTITVNAQTLNLISGNPSPTVCIGSTLTTIVFATGGVATNAVLTGTLPNGITGSFSGNSFTISGSPTELGSFNYTITTTGTCSATSMTGTILVNNGSVGGIVSSPVPICSGATGTLNLSGNTGNVVRWESSIDNGVTWINISNTTTTLSYVNLTVPTQYRAFVKSGSCNGVYSTVEKVAIKNYWTGTISNDWQVAGNWSDNQVPSMSCPTVFIPAGTPHAPTLMSGAATIGDLVIHNNAHLIVSNDAVLRVAGAITSSPAAITATDGTI